MEKYQGKIVFIFAGYNEQMERFLGYNPSVRNRIPNSMKFKDYENDELLEIFGGFIRSRFDGKMVVESMYDGIYARILVKRLAGGRGVDGFGNGSTIEVAFAKVRERQAKRYV